MESKSRKRKMTASIWWIEMISEVQVDISCNCIHTVQNATLDSSNVWGLALKILRKDRG